MIASLPRHYVEIPTAAVTPEIRALCVSVTDLGDGRSLAKIRRAHVEIDLEDNGDLVRYIPPEIDAIALTSPYGSSVARVVLDEAALKAAKPEELAARAEACKLDPKTATVEDVLAALHGVRSADDCDCSERVTPTQAEALLASPHVTIANRNKLAACATMAVR